MSFINESIQAMVLFWQRLGNAARALAVVGGLGLVALVVAVGFWSSRPQYISLAAGLAPSEAAEIISRLESKSIKYQLNFSGSTVMVAKSQWNQARLLVDDVATFSANTAEFDSGMLGDPDMNRYKLLKHREESLATTIRRISGISNAAVHIAFVKKSPFQHDRETTTASVVLELRQGASFSREQSAAIVALVAGSVEGLDPDGVSVMDTQGHMLSSSHGDVDSSVSAHFEFRRRLESELAAKATTMLVQLLGEGKAMVRVSADLDFTSLERTETKFDPALKVRSQEEIRTFSTTGQVARAGGVAGSDSNLRGSARTASYEESPSKTTEESNSTTYENAKTIDVVKEAPGTIERLTIAVMADLNSTEPPTESEEESTPATPVSVTRENIEAIVKQAVGFDGQRGDEIEVLVSHFHTPDAIILPPAGANWDKIDTIVRNASLGLAAIVALVISLLTLKKMKPITIPTDPSQANTDPGDLLSSLSERIRENPETMQAIISAWMSDDNEDSNSRRAA
jgi:flagellar M-ring protein FliF